MTIRPATRRMPAAIAALGLVLFSCSHSSATDAEPYRLELRRTPDALEIEGFVPDEHAKVVLVEAASAAFPDLPLTVALTDRPDAPARFTDAAMHALALFSDFADGEMVLSGQEVSFSGSTYHERARSRFDAALAGGWPEGYAVSGTAVTAGPAGPVVAAAACEDALREFMAESEIEFETGRTNILARSRALLDRVAYEAARCPEALIAVAGHTDSDGTEEANYRLSLDRVHTVIDLLTADGIAPRRFTALGYGESRPLASNATEAGKARNRRIEFVLRD